MPGNKPQRQGGIRIDPATAAWQQSAATNPAARSRKQTRDAERVRIKLDVPEYLKDAIMQKAQAEDTSGSQLAAFLLAWAMRESRRNPALAGAIEASKRRARSITFEWDLAIPEEWELELSD